jgi:hypothetical protein
VSEDITIGTSTVSDKLADERDYLELHFLVCRECDYSTGTPLSDEKTVYARHNDHYDATGHNRFWKYTISRSRGRIGHSINEL